MRNLWMYLAFGVMCLGYPFVWVWALVFQPQLGVGFERSLSLGAFSFVVGAVLLIAAAITGICFAVSG